MLPLRVDVKVQMLILFAARAACNRINVNHGQPVYSHPNNHQHRLFLQTIVCKLLMHHVLSGEITDVSRALAGILGSAQVS